MSANVAGLVTSRKNRVTGLIVSVYDGEAAGMDTFAGRWQTVCETHGSIISSTSQKLALSAMTYPPIWCEECQKEKKTGWHKE